MHDYLENTIASMRAAFAYGADIVEIDVQPTTDGHFVVFHDWTLECRTNGHGVTREQPLAYLESLDISYGYTADGGKTYPFRGRGVGLMPNLAEVLDTFPDRRFLLNIKSNDPAEADQLVALLRTRLQPQRGLLMVYGGERPTARALALMPELRGFTRASVKACFVRYVLVGWWGYVPETCRQTIQILPADYARYLWGWPHRFIARMEEVDTAFFATGPVEGANEQGALDGVDSIEALEALGPDYRGGIWTNRIEVIGPRLRALQ